MKWIAIIFALFLLPHREEEASRGRSIYVLLNRNMEQAIDHKETAHPSATGNSPSLWWITQKREMRSDTRYPDTYFCLEEGIYFEPRKKGKGQTTAAIKKHVAFLDSIRYYDEHFIRRAFHIRNDTLYISDWKTLEQDRLFIGEDSPDRIFLLDWKSAHHDSIMMYEVKARKGSRSEQA